MSNILIGRVVSFLFLIFICFIYCKIFHWNTKHVLGMYYFSLTLHHIASERFITYVGRNNFFQCFFSCVLTLCKLLRQFSAVFSKKNVLLTFWRKHRTVLFVKKKIKNISLYRVYRNIFVYFCFSQLEHI